jgi:hypothetical protein
MSDEGKLNQFIGQMLSDLGGAASVAMVRIGDALGAPQQSLLVASLLVPNATLRSSDRLNWISSHGEAVVIRRRSPCALKVSWLEHSILYIFSRSGLAGLGVCCLRKYAPHTSVPRCH